VATKKMSSTTVYSAGAVIISGEKRHQKVAVIHRPHRNDWSFPKGKTSHYGAVYELKQLFDVFFHHLLLLLQQNNKW